MTEFEGLGSDEFSEFGAIERFPYLNSLMSDDDECALEYLVDEIEEDICTGAYYDEHLLDTLRDDWDIRYAEDDEISSKCASVAYGSVFVNDFGSLFSDLFEQRYSERERDGVSMSWDEFLLLSTSALANRLRKMEKSRRGNNEWNNAYYAEPDRDERTHAANKAYWNKVQSLSTIKGQTLLSVISLYLDDYQVGVGTMQSDSGDIAHASFPDEAESISPMLDAAAVAPELVVSKDDTGKKSK